MVRPVPNATTFALLRDAYFSVKESAHDPHDEELKELFKESPSGALIDFSVRQTKYGRGVFALSDVPKGKAVWESSRFGIFRTEAQWRTFLDLLSPELQYDVTMWAYVMDWDSADSFVLALDFDEECLMNHGGELLDYDPTLTGLQPSNLRSVEVEEEDWQYVATQDIKVGEELLVDYSQFHSYGAIDWFDDLWDELFFETA